MERLRCIASTRLRPIREISCKGYIFSSFAALLVAANLHHLLHQKYILRMPKSNILGGATLSPHCRAVPHSENSSAITAQWDPDISDDFLLVPSPAFGLHQMLHITKLKYNADALKTII